MNLILLRALLLLGLVSAWEPSLAQVRTSDVLLQNAISGTAPGATMDVAYYNTVMMDVTITGTATVTFETAGSGVGSTVGLTCISVADTTRTVVTSTSANGVYQCGVAGLQGVRARVSSYTSGTVTVFARASTAVFSNGGGGGGGGGGGTSSTFNSAIPASGTAAGARDTAGNMQPLALNGTGTGQSLLTHCDNCAGASDNTGTGSLNALNAAVSVALTGVNGAAVEFNTGTLAGSTVVAEVSADGGTTWSGAFFANNAGVVSPSLSNPSASQYTITWPGGGFSTARVRVSGFGSGTVTANVRATQNAHQAMLYGTDGTTMRGLSMTAAGLAQVDLSQTGANTNPLLVTGTGGSFPIPANSSVNLSQLGGTNLSGANVVDTVNAAFRMNCINGCATAADTTATGSLATAGNTVSVALAGLNGAAVEFNMGTLAGGTVLPEVSTDGGTTWSAAVFLDLVTGAMSASLSNPSAAQYTIGWPGGGVSHVRVRLSAVTSGSVTANVRATANRSYFITYGSDGTNMRPIVTTTTGLTKVDLSGTASNSNNLNVNMATCTGCALDQASFTAGTSSAGAVGGVFNDTITALTSGQSGAVRLTTDRMLFTNLGKVGGSAIALGQTTMASSLPVAIASNQSAVPASQSGNWNLAILDGVGGTNKAQVNASNQLSVVCANCTGSGVSQVDNTGFTYGTTVFVPMGGVYNATITNLTSGNAGAAALTTDRMLFTNLGKVGGSAIALGQTTMAASLPVTLSSNQSNVPSNTVQLNGVTIDTNSGLKSNGTQRLVLATDQPNLTTPLNINTAQVNGITIDTNSGIKSAGTQRMVLATDQPNLTTPLNTQDQADGATGAAVPAKAIYLGGNGSGNTTGLTVCDKWKPISITASTNIITGVASKKTYICSIQIGPIPTATNVALVEGTTTTNPCDTGTAGMAGGTTAATGWNIGANGGTNIGSGLGIVTATATAADHVCLLVSAANQISGVISYTQY